MKLYDVLPIIIMIESFAASAICLYCKNMEAAFICWQLACLTWLLFF
jgi:hypothetical protein